MTDEKKDSEASRSSRHELAETPFGGYSGKSSSEQTDTEKVEVQAPTAEEPETPAEEPEIAAEEFAAEEIVPTEDQEQVVEAAEEPPTLEEEAAPAIAPTEVRRQEEAAATVDYSRTFRQLAVGDVVEGTVVHIDKEGVLVDVGTKSEGIVRLHELSRDAVQNPEDVVQVGEKISVYVMNTENEEGNLLLSKKRADFERAWNRVEEGFKLGKVINAMVTDRVKGGLVVDLGIRGFVPGSHVGSGKIKNLERYVGQSLPLKVVEVDRERRKVVLSHRLAVEEERSHHRQQTLSSLAEGQVRQGVIRRLTEYGAFVDLGGIDGLLHISEMSWTRINHPSDMLRVGQRIQVLVLKLNLGEGKVSLGLRQILPDPWSEIQGRYNEGDVIKGRVSRLVPFGAFVQVSGGVEGIIPVAELAPRRVNRPEDVVSIGQEIEAKIIDLRPEERRMTLSLRKMLPEREQREQREQRDYPGYVQQPTPRTTVGDLVGEALSRARRRKEPSEEEEIAEAPATKAAKPKGKGGPKKVREAKVTDDELADLETSEILEEEVAVTEAEAEEVVMEIAADEPMVTLGELLGDKISAAEAEVVEEAKEASVEKSVAETAAVEAEPVAEPKAKAPAKKPAAKRAAKTAAKPAKAKAGEKEAPKRRQRKAAEKK